MHFKTSSCVYCVVIICFTSASIIVSNETPELQVVSYNAVRFKYNKFIHFPPPYKTIIRTRDLIVENVMMVQPIGVIVHKCPEVLKTPVEERMCYPTDVKERKLQVKIRKTYSGIRKKSVTVQEHIRCECHGQM